MATEQDFNFTSYSDFKDSDIDPTHPDQACQVRSGLIFPNNSALIPQKYHGVSGNNHHGKNGNNDGTFHKKLYRCHLCQEKYLNLYTLNKHFKMRHLVNNNDIKQIIIPKWYCSKCKKEFSYILKDNKQEIKHYCLNSEQKIEKINEEKKEIKLCLIDKLKDDENEEVFNIKRIRYECRKDNDLLSIEQWLKYELIKRKLSRNDYINAAKVFIGVKGYKIAIQLLEKSASIFVQDHNDDDDDNEEQKLIDIAKQLNKL